MPPVKSGSVFKMLKEQAEDVVEYRKYGIAA
jgi:hypothetical protein